MTRYGLRVLVQRTSPRTWLLTTAHPRGAYGPCWWYAEDDALRLCGGDSYRAASVRVVGAGEAAE